MVYKTTQGFYGVSKINTLVLVLLLSFNFQMYSQVITGVFPTRVTSGSRIVVVGTGFFGVDPNDVAISGIGIESGSVVIVSDTEINLTIRNYNPLVSPLNDTFDRILTVGGGVNAADLISYIRPSLKQFNVGDAAFRVTEVFTNWDYDGRGYYRSTWFDGSNTSDQTTWPDDSHELLAYTVDGVTYTTGVADNILDSTDDGSFVFDVSGASGITYIPEDYKAYSTNGITGTPNNNNFLLMADEIDGFTDAVVLNDQVRATVYDVMIDGGSSGRGLDMGTGVANLNQDATIRFFSGNGVFGAVSDNIPDLLITQVARAGGLGDVYYYADVDGNIVGRPVQLRIPNSAPILFNWQLDLYRLNTSVAYDSSYPVSTVFGGDETKEFRMAALKLSDFEIAGGTDDTIDDHISNVTNISTQAGGSADMAFMAYNQSAFDIKSPEITVAPASRNVCKPDNSRSITFSVEAEVNDPTPSPPTPNPEEISYEWFKNFDKITGETSDTFDVTTIGSTDLGSYRVRVSNDFGTIDVPFTLLEGGTPTFWTGTHWEFPANFYVGNNPANAVKPDFVTPDDERQLIFSSNYNENIDLEGCDCLVLREQEVTIREDRELKLYGKIEVEGDLIIVSDGLSQLIVGGEITFEDDASLVQTKPVTTNENGGNIKYIRQADADFDRDYKYWSSPVAGFDIANINGDLTYRWDVDASNNNSTTGDWISASGIMNPGQGYIKRVPNSSVFDTEFVGVPHNGRIEVPVSKSDSPVPVSSDDRHWNLVGNPYPSAIDARSFLQTNTNLEGNVQIWDTATAIANNPANDPFYDDFVFNYGDQYFTYNNTGGTQSGFDGNIASGQAFFVQVLNSAPENSEVIFNNAMRFDSAENGYDNDRFFRSANPEDSAINNPLEKQLLWLALVDDNNTSTTALVGYVDGATDGMDRLYDARKRSDAMRLYSVLGEDDLIIQGKASPFQDSDIVPLGIDILEDGIYSIAIDAVSGAVFENDEQPILLEDTYLNLVHDLRSNPYSFTTETGTVKDRFVLRYRHPNALSIQDQEISNTFIYVKQDRLFVKSDIGIQSVVVYSITGKQLVTYQLDADVSREFNTRFDYPKGAYLTVVNYKNGTVTGKKIMN